MTDTHEDLFNKVLHMTCHMLDDGRGQLWWGWVGWWKKATQIVYELDDLR